MSQSRTSQLARWWIVQTAQATLVLVLTLTLIVGPTVAHAQAESMPPGAEVRVANTGGARLNLRSGPSTAQSIVAKLAVGETLTVTGGAQVVGSTRWLPVRTASGQTGWVSAQFVAAVSAPTPARAPEATPTPAGTSGHASDAGASETPKGKPLVVEAKLKYPEVKGRDQEITVWVTRDGAPVPGATVTVEARDGDDGERFRELDPTDEEGRTRRSFDIRREKGTVELQVEAVAPDGGEGRVVVSYFRR